MIVVTGAAGFIGSCLVKYLNNKGNNSIVIVDDFSIESKKQNWEYSSYSHKVERADFFDWLMSHHTEVDFIFHLGARTDTAEFDKVLLNKLNLDYTKRMWRACVSYNIPLVYASSAATYGLGEYGYEDKHELSEKLQPLNPYGVSKNEFDIWALSQEEKPKFWTGLKFFNVYGPNEYHKGRMASVVFHAFNQIQKTGKMNLFQSHNPDYKNGEQLRDFVYVKDVVSVCEFLMNHQKDSGIYNLGSGKAETFLTLTESTFKALGKVADIGFIPTPEDIRDKYQYYTKAEMRKLKEIGYDKPFHSLEEGVIDYVTNYLLSGKMFS